MTGVCKMMPFWSLFCVSTAQQHLCCNNMYYIIIIIKSIWKLLLSRHLQSGAVMIQSNKIGVRSWNCGCLVNWFCYQLIAKPVNKTAKVLWPNPYDIVFITAKNTAGHKSVFKLTKDMDILPSPVSLCGVHCEDLWDYNCVINAPHCIWCQDHGNHHMGQVTKLQLSCYLVLLSIDSKTR